MAKPFRMPTGFDVAKNAAASWAGQKGFEQIRPIVKGLVKLVPSLAIDTPMEKIVAEAMSALPGVVKSFFPNQEMLTGFIADVTREVIQELKSASEGIAEDKTRPLQGGRKIAVKQNQYLVSRKRPTVAVLNRCSCRHQLRDDGTPNPDFGPIDIEDIALGSLHAPAAQAEGWQEGCFCAAGLKADLTELKGPAKEAKPEPKDDPKNPRSLADFLGAAHASTDESLRNRAKKLQKLIHEAVLTPIEIGLMEHCDTEHEFTLLLACENEKELRAVLPLLQAKAERGLANSVGNSIQLGAARAAEVLGKHRKGAKERGKTQADRLAVIKLCGHHKTSRDEVFWVMKPYDSDLKSVNDLTQDHVLFALRVPDGEEKTPLQAYRDGQEQQKRQHANQQPKGNRIKRFFQGC